MHQGTYITSNGQAKIKMDPLKKWKDAKRTKNIALQTSILNVGFYIRQERSIDHIQPYLIINMSVNSHRALTLLRSQSHNLGIEVALWHQNQSNVKACKGMQGRASRDEYHMLASRG